MAFNLPLPKVVADVGPGGGIPTAIGALNALTTQNLENKMQALKNQYYGPNIESEMNNRNAFTKGQEITNQYLPDKLKYANAMAQMENQTYMPRTQAEINNKIALTKGYEIANQFAPEKTQLELEKQRQENEWYARNQQSKIDANKALSNYRNNGGIGAKGTGGKDLNDMAIQLRKEHPDWEPQQITDASNAYLDGNDSFPDGTPLPPISGGMRRLLESSYKRATDVGQRSQERYASTLETVIKRADNNAKIAAEYSGLLGNAEGNIEKATNLLGGQSSKKFQAYNNFVRVDVPTMAGEYMRQLGVNASDEQKKLYLSVVNPVTWYTNPKTALAQWEYFKSLAKDVGKTITKSAYQTSNDLRKDNSNDDPLGIL